MNLITLFPAGTRRPRWSCTRCEREAKWGASGRHRSAHIWVWTASGGAPPSLAELGSSWGKTAAPSPPPSPTGRPARDSPLTVSRSSRTAAHCWTSTCRTGKRSVKLFVIFLCIYVNMTTKSALVLTSVLHIHLQIMNSKPPLLMLWGHWVNTNL